MKRLAKPSRDNPMPSFKSLLFLPLVALCLPACAAQNAASAPPSQGQAQGQGMVVVRDAQTGELRNPTPDEMRAMQPPASSAKLAPTQPRMVIGQGGRRSVQLGERHMVYSVVNRDSEGKLAEQCVHGHDAATSAIAQAAEGKARPATKHEEHSHERH
ncbi:post-PEP-CTERM-1 domain-containing protein [Massilia sp. IC2-476]|uniref:post-PEP-CTERM-1 domain-containing protein n=1 Tax=Massilia sp. IC2-476 TaxID=2887199 RepID=UPI001D120739|nr:hypothetical protein [Massilia sp. IC2-476]MCC2972304.1 hypothetical protein [Massilia sp. IC2-476]